MAEATCNAADWITAAACYETGCMSFATRQALRIYYLAIELQAKGGTDYRTNVTALENAVKAFFPMSKPQVDAALTEVYAENAVAAGGTVPALATAMAQAVKIQQSRYMDLLELFLICQLGSHH